jgi:predicted 3-demethylubiquinone-9 3-methyltransferase (glyoxalase superfamily)
MERSSSTQNIPSQQEQIMQNKITPFLWFDGEAEDAAKFYVSIFANSSIGKVVHYGDAGPGPKGSVMTVTFTLDGREFYALNGGPHFKFTPAVSLFVECNDQAEVDRYWEELSAGGAKGQCGWLSDKYGLSWQVVPTALSKLLHDSSPTKSAAVMQAMMKMTKLDVAALQRAHDVA